MIRDLPPTRWTRILRARDTPAERRAVWDEVLRQYWQPLFAFARRRGLGVEDASDAVQGFAELALAGGLIERADPGHGRLRSYLVRSFANHLRDRHEHAVAEKRGGGRRPLAIDTEVMESALPSLPGDPESAFDVAWAEHTFAVALARVRAEYVAASREGDVELLLRHLQAEELPPLRGLAAEKGVSVAQLKSFFHRGRERFRAALVETVRETLGAEDDVDAELRHLQELLAR